MKKFSLNKTSVFIGIFVTVAIIIAAVLMLAPPERVPIAKFHYVADRGCWELDTSGTNVIDDEFLAQLEEHLEYQENPDSVFCSENWDSSSTCENVYDGDWESYGSATEGSAFLEINYTKPAGAVGALWQVKDSSGVKNLTIPSECWNAFPNKLKIRIVSSNWPENQYVKWGCWDGSNFQFLEEAPLSNVYEESLWWSISYPEFSICYGSYDFSQADLSWSAPAILIKAENVALAGSEVEIIGASSNSDNYLNNSVGIRCEAPNCKIKSFTIKNFDVGVLVAKKGNGAVVRENKIYSPNPRSSGIYLSGATNVDVAKNLIYGELQQPMSTPNHGVFGYNAQNVTVRGGVISSFTKALNFGHSKNVQIKNVKVNDSHIGINVYGRSDNIFVNKTKKPTFTGTTYGLVFINGSRVNFAASRNSEEFLIAAAPHIVKSEGLEPDCYWLSKTRVNEFDEDEKTYTLCPEFFNVSAKSGLDGVYSERSKPFVKISGNNVLFDCNGATLIGAPIGFRKEYWIHTVGISVTGENNIVQNCNVGGFDANIFVSKSGSGAEIRDSKFINERGVASVYLQASNIKVHDNIIQANGPGYKCPVVNGEVDTANCELAESLSEGCIPEDGVYKCGYALRGTIGLYGYLKGRKNVEIYNNKISGWKYGIQLGSGDNISVYGNTLSGGFAGFSTYLPKNSTSMSAKVSNNTFVRGEYGVLFFDGTENMVSGEGNVFEEVNLKTNEEVCVIPHSGVCEGEQADYVSYLTLFTENCCCDEEYKYVNGECKKAEVSSGRPPPRGSSGPLVLPNKTEEKEEVVEEENLTTDLEKPKMEKEPLEKAEVKKNKVVVIVGLVILIIIIVGTIVWWFKFRRTY